MSTTSVERQLSNEVPSRATARLRAFRRDVQHALPGKITRVVLFGSRARGDARPDPTMTWPSSSKTCRIVARSITLLQTPRTVTFWRRAYSPLLAVPADYLEAPIR